MDDISRIGKQRPEVGAFQVLGQFQRAIDVCVDYQINVRGYSRFATKRSRQPRLEALCLSSATALAVERELAAPMLGGAFRPAMVQVHQSWPDKSTVPKGCV